MNVKKNIVVKSAAWYTISNFLLRGISFITTPIFTRLMSTSDYGMASNFATWVSIMACVTNLGLGYGIVRGKVEFEDDFKEFISSIQALTLISSSFWMILAVLFSKLFSELMALDRMLTVIIFVYLLFYHSVSYAQTNYRFEYKYKENIGISAFSTIANVLLSFGLILVFNDQRFYGRILGNILPIFILGIIFCIGFFIRGKCFYNKIYWKYALVISIPMIPHGLAMILLAQIDRVMIIRMCGNSQAGIYSFGYSYAVVISLLINALNDAVQPVIFTKFKENNYKSVDGLTHKICLGVILVAAEMALVGPEALKILGPEEYYEAIWVIAPVIFGSVFQMMYQNYSLVEIYYKKTLVIAIGSILAALTNFGLNYYFIGRCGYLAASWTTLAGYIFLMGFHFTGARNISKEDIFGYRNMLSESLVCILALAFSMALYLTAWWIRYVFAAIIAIVIFIRYKGIVMAFLKR